MSIKKYKENMGHQNFVNFILKEENIELNKEQKQILMENYTNLYDITNDKTITGENLYYILTSTTIVAWAQILLQQELMKDGGII